MHKLANRTLAGLAVFALTIGLTTTIAGEADAKGKSTQTEAEWINFDAAANTVTVKVLKPGRTPEAKKMLTKNKEATFAVKPEGSVLTRTTVAINGVKGEITDIPKGKTVNIYWRPDETDPNVMRARKIDVILSDAELDEKYGSE
jgi:hypothetical protein